MPYLRITCATIPPEQRRAIAERLTTAIVDLFFSPHSPLSREELRERTTVHFTSYGEDELSSLEPEHLGNEMRST